MKNKRINLKTSTSRNGKVFTRTKLPIQMDSLMADQLRLVKWIQAIRHSMEAVKIDPEFENFRKETEWGDQVTKLMSARERRMLAAWWRFCNDFDIFLKTRGAKVMATALILINQHVERSKYTIIKSPLSAESSTLDGKLFTLLESFIERNWQELKN